MPPTDSQIINQIRLAIQEKVSWNRGAVIIREARKVGPLGNVFCYVVSDARSFLVYWWRCLFVLNLFLSMYEVY